MEKKIFWISFTILGLVADFTCPIWWAVAGNHPGCICQLVDRVSQ